MSADRLRPPAPFNSYRVLPSTIEYAATGVAAMGNPRESWGSPAGNYRSWYPTEREGVEQIEARLRLNNGLTSVMQLDRDRATRDITSGQIIIYSNRNERQIVLPFGDDFRVNSRAAHALVGPALQEARHPLTARDQITVREGLAGLANVIYTSQTEGPRAAAQATLTRRRVSSSKT